MFKIIKLNDFSYPDSLGLLINDPLFKSENFERTLAGKGLTDVLDLEKRSSWTHNSTFHIYTLPNEVSQFMEQNNILTHKDDMKYASFSLIKYEEGDFFLNHRDTNMSNEIDGTHEYTCLIFCPYGEDYTTLEGGELMLRHPDRLYEIKFDPAVETRQGGFVMVIFSIDMYHEVLPIIKGSRYVFKKPLFVKKTSTKIIETNELDELCDGVGGFLEGKRREERGGIWWRLLKIFGVSAKHSKCKKV